MNVRILMTFREIVAVYTEKPRYEDAWGNGGNSPRIPNLGIRI
jgi:hypothetical protein